MSTSVNCIRNSRTGQQICKNFSKWTNSCSKFHKNLKEYLDEDGRLRLDPDASDNFCCGIPMHDTQYDLPIAFHDQSECHHILLQNRPEATIEDWSAYHLQYYDRHQWMSAQEFHITHGKIFRMRMESDLEVYGPALAIMSKEEFMRLSKGTIATEVLFPKASRKAMTKINLKPSISLRELELGIPPSDGLVNEFFGNTYPTYEDQKYCRCKKTEGHSYRYLPTVSREQKSLIEMTLQIMKKRQQDRKQVAAKPIVAKAKPVPKISGRMKSIHV